MGPGATPGLVLLKTASTQRTQEGKRDALSDVVRCRVVRRVAPNALADAGALVHAHVVHEHLRREHELVEVDEGEGGGEAEIEDEVLFAPDTRIYPTSVSVSW